MKSSTEQAVFWAAIIILASFFIPGKWIKIIFFAAICGLCLWTHTLIGTLIAILLALIGICISFQQSEDKLSK